MSQKFDLIFILPGRPSSGRQWLSTHVAITNLMAEGRKIGIKHAAGSSVLHVRNQCLSEVGNEMGQEPLGSVEYGHLIWVDSDNIIDADQIRRLISFNVDFVSAWSRKASGSNLSCGYRDMEYFNEEDKKLLRQPLKLFKRTPLTEDQMKVAIDGIGILEVDYTGLPLSVMKYGVMEKLEYPWFLSWVIEYEKDGVKMAELISEDEGLCIRLQEKGFQIFVDPDTNVGHEKMVIR